MKFEEAMAQLEETVKKLDSGSASLEESLELFEKGIKLSKLCQKMLDDAEKRVSVLTSGENGGMEKQTFPDIDEQ